MMDMIQPLEFERLPPQPPMPEYRADHDGGDEDDESQTYGLMVGTLDWWVNHPQSPRNLKPVMWLGKVRP